MLRNRLDVQVRDVCPIFRVYGWLQSLWTPCTPFAPPLEPLEYTAESKDRTGSQHDIQCSEPAAVARGQKCGAGVKSLRTAGYAWCPEICSLAIRLWVGGLSRRLLNYYGHYCFYYCCHYYYYYCYCYYYFFYYLIPIFVAIVNTVATFNTTTSSWK